MSGRADLEAQLRARAGPFLARWFASYGADALYEVECKVKGVSAGAFAHMLRKLDAFPDWRAKASRPPRARARPMPTHPSTRSLARPKT